MVGLFGYNPWHDFTTLGMRVRFHMVEDRDGFSETLSDRDAVIIVLNRLIKNGAIARAF